MKKITSQSIIGQQGVNFIERIVLGMKYIWRPTPGLDVGIDGEIELCDPTTGAATNSIIKVQSKATIQSFSKETPSSFEFLCDQRDIDYWLRGNAPVILIVSRPETNEAYWVSVKQYFSDPANLKTRKVIFDKQRNRFDENCAGSLKSLAVFTDSGIYFSPVPINEVLYTNLLTINALSEHIYLAESLYNDPKEIWDKFRGLHVTVGSEWILKNKLVTSFHPLDEYPFDQVCTFGSCERFDVGEWADSEDEDTTRDFVQLLNSALRERTKLLGLRYHKDLELYYFPASKDLRTIRIDYQGLKRKAGREVFNQYSSKSDRTQKTYCRHSAFKGFFVKTNDGWYLEITPTYYFTKFGQIAHPKREELIKGIKRVERNPAVFGQLLMWANFLSRPLKTLFSAEYPFLGFGELQKVTLNMGIPDDTWYQAEEELEKETIAKKDNQLELFGL